MEAAACLALHHRHHHHCSPPRQGRRYFSSTRFSTARTWPSLGRARPSCLWVCSCWPCCKLQAPYQDHRSSQPPAQEPGQGAELADRRGSGERR